MADEAWIRNCWQVAAYAKEIGPQLFARTFMDEPVVMWRLTDGSVVALADRCAHRFVPLSVGRLDEHDTIHCGYHGMRFDRSGHCVGVPGQAGPLPKVNVRAFPIVERHAFVWIWMGVPELADPTAVPDVHWFDDPEWACISGYRRVAASYRLINDNLLDLSHESFVHGDTIGNTAVADAPFVTEILDNRVVKLHREMLGCEPPPAYQTSTGITTKIDRWHTTFYTPPAFHLNYNGSKPSGTGMDRAKEGRVMHLITPESARTSHYFYGACRQHGMDDASLTESLRAFGETTIDQDQVILELQQQAFDRNADQEPARIKLDAGPVLGRRLLERRIVEDQALHA